MVVKNTYVELARELFISLYVMGWKKIGSVLVGSLLQ